MTTEEMQQYSAANLVKLRTICKAQWDFLQERDINSWLNNNFKNDIEGKYYAIKILLNTIYYSKRNIISLLNYGIFEKIYGDFIKDELINNQNIYITNTEAEARINNFKRETLIIPLCDSNKPSESGNSMISHIVHNEMLNDKQVAYHWDITEDKIKTCKFLIIVDDCIGSGNQLKRFWKSEKLIEIRLWCKKYNTKIFYLALIGYKQSIETLKSSPETTDIKLVVCDELNNSNRIFKAENKIWNDEEERNRAETYFLELRKNKGVSFRGYRTLDFAVIIHDRIPNWSIPIFWKKSSDWENLINRKSSNG